MGAVSAITGRFLKALDGSVSPNSTWDLDDVRDVDAPLAQAAATKGDRDRGRTAIIINAHRTGMARRLGCARWLGLPRRITPSLSLIGAHRRVDIPVAWDGQSSCQCPSLVSRPDLNPRGVNRVSDPRRSRTSPRPFRFGRGQLRRSRHLAMRRGVCAVWSLPSCRTLA